MIRLFASAAAILALAACQAIDVPATVAAFGNDRASMCLHIGATVYTPTVDVARVNAEGVAIKCGEATVTTVQAPGSGIATVQFPGTLTIAK